MQAPLVKITGKLSNVCKRNLGIFAPVLQKASDPIQQLFLDKIREYKSKAVGGKLVEPSSEIQKELKNDEERIRKLYNITEKDLTKFPTFNFTEPKITIPFSGKN